MKKYAIAAAIPLLAALFLAAPSPCRAWFVTGFEKVWEDGRDEWIEEITGMAFVEIPAGSFLMGSPESEEGRYRDEGPQHTVALDSFWLGKYEVTNAQFRKFRPNHDSKEYEGHSLNGDDQPAVHVSWNDASAFVEWLNGQERYKRSGTEFFLPSEAQWEYACRAGTETARFWGDNPDQACAFANVKDSTAVDDFGWGSPHDCNDSFAVTAPVDSDKFEPNPWGLHHMLGNVWEWCRDDWDSEAYNKRGSSETNPVVEASGSGRRSYRGGSWRFDPAGVRCALRGSYAPGVAVHNLGFRLGGKNVSF